MPSTYAPLSDWLTWLEMLSPTEINLGLDRVQHVLKRLDLPRPAHLLLIAGTNGKGSCVTMADALLRASGMSVGAYTSPHIARYNERIVVNGIAASDAEIISAFGKIEAVRGDTELTYFEFGTLAAAVVFAAADLDVWVLEVGLGGRLDATNAFKPTASLITNVSLDHCDWLGDDVETIAVEKAGIMRAGVRTVFAAAEMPVAIRRQAEAIGATLLVVGRDFDFQVVDTNNWRWSGASGELQGLQLPGLIGEFQTSNAAAVLALIDAAGLLGVISSELVNRILPGLSLPGRSQRLQVNACEWFVDVAHNPAAAEALAVTLGATAPPGTTFAIVGLLGDKDVEGIIKPLAEHTDHWIAITAGSQRAVPADELARQISNLTGLPCLVAPSPVEAIEFCRRSASENDRILVTGSFYVVGPILDQLDSRQKI